MTASPHKLSQPFAPWYAQARANGTPALGAVVIGSGYGGAVAALRLAEKGHAVVVLERGSEFLPGDFPADASLLPKALRAPSRDGRRVMGRASGLVEMRAGPGVAAIVANGVGGGSLINAGVALAPEDEVFAQPAWPADIRTDAQGGHGLARHLAQAAAELGATPWTQAPQLFPKTGALARWQACLLAPKALRGVFAQDAAAPRRAPPPFTTVPLTIDAAKCSACGNCASGCNVPDAKRTLRDTYLQRAVATGRVTVLSSATVYRIAPQGEGAANGWLLTVLATPQIDTAASLAALADTCGWLLSTRLLVLAAGSFGSTELLQRSQAAAGGRFALSAALGSRFSTNGDGLHFSLAEPDAVHAVGVGADAHRDRHAAPPAGTPAHRVGPTITAMIDLRDQASALERRVVIQEAAIPGAIARPVAEMLATAYTLQRLAHCTFGMPNGVHADPLSAGDFDAPPTGRRTRPLLRHTQVLLAMGHDQARGQIVWVGGRDASVPYWADPGALETHRVQDALRATLARTGGTPIANPLWQLLPPTATAVMEGAPPPKLLTTVHPLGGCPMSDDPAEGVVDDLGRVWRGTPDRARWPGLWVLDGAIVPTSLGVNPLLTITALAERAAAHFPAPTSLARPAPPTPTTLNPCEATRSARQPLAVTMSERLAGTLRLAPSFAAALGAPADAPQAVADLDLDLVTEDWLSMWDQPAHALEQVRGSLRLEVDQRVFGYRVGAGPLRCELLAMRGSASERGLPWNWRRLGQALDDLPPLPLLRTVFTWAILRLPDLWRARHRPRPPERPPWPTLVMSFLKQLWHARELRVMCYRLPLVRDTALDQDTGPAATLPDLWLVGHKRVQYAASSGELLRYGWRRLRHPAAPRRLRESFAEQMSHLRIALHAQVGGERIDPATGLPPVHGPVLARGRLLMDVQSILGRVPLRLGNAGDTTSAALALAAYPGVFARFLLKTRLFDLRAPDYSHAPLADNAPPWQTDIEPVPGQRVKAERIALRVPRGHSSSASADEAGLGPVSLCLWRYRAAGGLPQVLPGTWHGQPVRRAKSVLLVHAFAQSGYSFTARSLGEHGMAAVLHKAGYEVWILEHRASTRLPEAQRPSTMDQIARWDIPAAVRRIVRLLDCELPRTPDRAPLQVFAFAQCVGAASLGMALLSQRLAHRPRSAGAKAPPLLAGAFLSQTHLRCIGTPLSQAKTWVPALIRDAFARAVVPFAVRGPVHARTEAWMDRLFAALPVPESEQCPRGDGHRGEDDCATCRRIRFIEAPLFRHANLLPETHAELPLLFGDANVRLFAQAAKCVTAEQLVDEDGFPLYVSDVNVSRHLALPIAFVHGACNELFEPESAHRTAALHARVHRDMAALMTQALNLPGDDRNTPCASSVLEIPDHGHIDTVIGRDAHWRLHQRMANAFDHLLAKADHGVAVDPAPPHATARLPSSGPIVGKLVAANGTLALRVAFQIDDRFSDGKRRSTHRGGGRTWAFARLYAGGATTPLATCHLDIRRTQAPPKNLFSHDGGWRNTGARFAHGELRIERAAVAHATQLRVECFSIHEVIWQPVPGPRQAALLPLPAVLDIGPPPTGQWSQHPVLDGWLAAALGQRLNHLDAMAANNRPSQPARSYIAQRPESPNRCIATVPRAAWEALDDNAGHATFVVGGCRYPGFIFERRRVDDTLARLRAGAAPPAFALLVGDQVYADATAGFVDEVSPSERFLWRHRMAFARGREARSWLAPPTTFGDWLCSLPVLMTPDDHEYTDGFPNGAVLTAVPTGFAPATQATEEAARDTMFAFQRLPSTAAPTRRWLRHDTGVLRVLMLDTRSRRAPLAARALPPAPALSLLDTRLRRVIRRWLNQPEASTRLNVIANGSVVLPGLRPHADPSGAGDFDNFQWCPEDRQWLLDELAGRAAADAGFRFLLVSGDYHASHAAAIELHDDAAAPGAAGAPNIPIGAALVAPPWYAPMPYMDATPEQFWLDENLPVRVPGGTWVQPCLRLNSHGMAPLRGSGWCTVNVQRLAASGAARYRIVVTRELIDRAVSTPGPAAASTQTFDV